MTTTRRHLLLGAAASALLAGCGAAARPDPDAPEAAVPEPHPYGDAAIQVADLYLPAEPQGAAVVVLVHGGFWYSDYDRSLEVDVAADLVAAGYAVWNLDYRSIGNGGGFPTTFEDVAAGCDALVDAAAGPGLDLDRVALVGHSAGGHLALWAAGRSRLPADAPGASPRLRPAAVVSQAGVADLALSHELHLGGDAAAAFLGEPADRPLPADLLARTSPAAMLPLGVPTLMVTGDADDKVPARVSEEYAAAAEAAGDDVVLEVVPGEGHFEHLDPASEVWRRTRAYLDERLRLRSPRSTARRPPSRRGVRGRARTRPAPRRRRR